MMKQLALNKGLRVGDTKRPEEPSYDMLTKLSSPGFDKAYLAAMTKDQEQDVAEFRRMSEQGQDPDLKVGRANPADPRGSAADGQGSPGNDGRAPLTRNATT